MRKKKRKEISLPNEDISEHLDKKQKKIHITPLSFSFTFSSFLEENNYKSFFLLMENNFSFSTFSERTYSNFEEFD